VPSLPANQRYLTVLSGGIFAIFISIGMAFLAEQVDRTFRTPDEVRSFLDIPVFATLPRSGGNGNSGRSGEIPTAQRTTHSETYVS
jgi:capsular polysaccharide biosynthesis protein